MRNYFTSLFKKEYYFRIKMNDPSDWSRYAEKSRLISKSIGRVLHEFSEIAATYLVNAVNREITQKVMLLDVACGWGDLTVEAVKKMVEQHTIRENDDVFIMTDLAHSMVKMAEENMRNLVCNLNDSHIRYSCFVMDASNPFPLIQEATITHIGCIFGIMFFPDIHNSLQKLRQCLVPRHGVAVISTWQTVDTVSLIESFARYADFYEEAAFAHLHEVVQICASPDAFRSTLIESGFDPAKTQIYEEGRSFSFPVSDEDCQGEDYSLLLALVYNPVIMQVFSSVNIETDIMPKWRSFLTSNDGARWTVVTDNSERSIVLKMKANIAVAYSL
jgi:ubiquinone/menaquinone biosynthesis C-methylase UbiE